MLQDQCQNQIESLYVGEGVCSHPVQKMLIPKMLQFSTNHNPMLPSENATVP